MRLGRPRGRLAAVALTLAALTAPVACSGSSPAPERTASAAPSTDAPVQQGRTEQTQDGLTIVHDAVYTGAGQQTETLDLYRPTRQGVVPAIVLIHGGGWYEGTKEEDAYLADAAAQRGYAVFDIDYPLGSPGFPTEGRYVQTAITWVRAHADLYGVDPARIGAWGTSAGGNLALWAATVGSGSLTTGSRLAVVVAWSAPIDLGDERAESATGVQTIRNYLGCDAQNTGDASCRQTAANASPVTFVDRTDPPMYLASSTQDGLVPIYQIQAMAAALQKAGVAHRTLILPGTRHAEEYDDDARAPTLAFFDQYLRP